jgi:hypothetical protein
MSCGFLDLNVHDHSRQSNVTRAFVPCVHCLSPAENAPAAYLCLHGLARIYKKFFEREMRMHVLSADASQAIASGLSQAFPGTQILTDIEHVRSGPYKKWSQKIRGGKDMQARITYWLSVLFHSRTYINYCNSFGILMKQLRQRGQDEFCNFLEDRYGPNGVSLEDAI